MTMAYLVFSGASLYNDNNPGYGDKEGDHMNTARNYPAPMKLTLIAIFSILARQINIARWVMDIKRIANDKIDHWVIS